MQRIDGSSPRRMEASPSDDVDLIKGNDSEKKGSVDTT